MYVFAEPVTEEQADEIQNAGEAAQKAFARDVVGLGEKADPEAPAWEDVQDDVDEQVGEDQSGALAETEDMPAKMEDTPAKTADTPAKTADTPAETEAAPTPTGPLMGWTLTVRNLVNGGYVEQPSKLDNQDEWKIEYHMKEIPEESRWKLYNALKERRHQLIGQDEEEASKGLKHYRDLIKRFSDKGRRWRNEQDKLNNASPGQLFRPLGPGSDVDAMESHNDVTKADEPLDENTTVEPSNDDAQATESMSQEKKEEVLEGMPASPS
jgi:hypothetical protein